MAVVKLEAFKRLQAVIAAAVPTLKDIILVRRKAGVQECIPNLVITPIRLRYMPDQEEELPNTNPSSVVIDVGNFEGLVQLRLSTSNLADRWDFEQKITDLFLATEGHPGVLITPVTACAQFGKFVASWELDDEEWSDAKASDGRFESIIVLNACIPALATRTAHTIQELRLGITGDMEGAFSPDTFAAPEVEIVEVNSDGTISAVTP